MKEAKRIRAIPMTFMPDEWKLLLRSEFGGVAVTRGSGIFNCVFPQI